ncbi:endonuclease/exonuclease/phosphatase family protein [Actinoplanes sp. NBRC 103695]|uniref:endonuclease/exonuclease/phosphatase family protein n=1 Tax=Actinoplanes sp. NBRC 103695 TaxID=3032202 RepID=UPI0024A47DDD|nr:endonuclease/exonuclease/phosphatase family protein [Actinoplanes sp. NBRC 103695]GLY99798.1 hypothetical protein Acsp02_70510 [Actinoplanes sp. NBRC 103695]
MIAANLLPSGQVGSDAVPGTTVGVLTWNVQHASAARSARQADWIAAQPDADVVVLTEVAGGRSGDSVAASLTGHGYRVHLTDSGGKDLRVLLATRVGDLEARPLDAAVLPHRAAGAVLHHPEGHQLALVGLYVPSRGPRNRRNLDKKAFQTAVTTLLERLPGIFGSGLPMLVAGDLNVLEPGHRPHHAVFGRWEYDFYSSFAARGFADLYRMHHPEGTDHSWFGRSGAGYRFDHLFCIGDQRLTVTGCRYLHAARSTGLSDHSAMSADLEWDVPSP